MLEWRFSEHNAVVSLARQKWEQEGRPEGQEERIWLTALAEFGTIRHSWQGIDGVNSLIITICHRGICHFVLCFPGRPEESFATWEEAAARAEDLASLDEHLITDPRANLTPSQMVDAKLWALPSYKEIFK